MGEEEVPLTPAVVHCVVFDKAPLGRRGYNEDQVDDFLDRVEATLAGADTLTAEEVRSAVFDAAPLIKRGYDEAQVDSFLDLVVEDLERRGGNGSAPRPPTVRQDAANGEPRRLAPVINAHQPGQALPPVPPPTPAETTNPMLFAVPPSLPAELAPRAPAAPAKPDEPAQPPETADGSAPAPAHNTAPPAAPAQPAPALPAAPPVPANTVAVEPPAVEVREPSGSTAEPEHIDLLSIPLPPAPPGERGYRPGDVEKLVRLLLAATDAAQESRPSAEDLANAKLSRTFFLGQGYRTDVVDALHAAWVDELKNRE